MKERQAKQTRTIAATVHFREPKGKKKKCVCVVVVPLVVVVVCVSVCKCTCICVCELWLWLRWNPNRLETTKNGQFLKKKMSEEWALKKRIIFAFRFLHFTLFCTIPCYLIWRCQLQHYRLEQSIRLLWFQLPEIYLRLSSPEDKDCSWR